MIGIENDAKLLLTSKSEPPRSLKSEICLALVLILIGCVELGAKGWTPASANGKTVDQAWLECDYEAEKAVPIMLDRTRSTFTQVFAQGDVRRKCMRAKGFYQTR